MVKKYCSICKVHHDLHLGCAKKAYSKLKKVKNIVAGRNSIYHEANFTASTFKFYCKNCETPCSICGSTHVLGNEQHFAAVCAAKHWFVAYEKELPFKTYFQTTKQNPWYCAKHAKASISPTPVTDQICKSAQPSPVTCNPQTHSIGTDNDHVVKQWNSNPRKKAFYILDQSGVFDVNKLHKESTDQRRVVSTIMVLFESILNIHEYKKDMNLTIKNMTQIWRKDNKTFLSQMLSKRTMQDNIFDSRTKFPYSLSLGALERLTKRNIEGYLNDELVYFFIFFLEQYQYWKMTQLPKDKLANKKILFYVLPPTFHLYMYPSDKDYPQTNYEKYVIQKDLGLDDSKHFYLQYKEWFESKAKYRLDLIFDKLKRENIVS